MRNFLRKNWALLTAFALPVGFVGMILTSTYIQSRLVSTNYDFVYFQCDMPRGYYSDRCLVFLDERFTIENGKILVNEVIDENEEDERNSDLYKISNARIFLHDTESNKSQEITIDQVEGLKVSELLTSPDGVTFSAEYHRSSGVFIFSSGDTSHRFHLKDGRNQRKMYLEGEDDQYYYGNNFKFGGWVLED